jgi:DedD protein
MALHHDSSDQFLNSKIGLAADHPPHDTRQSRTSALLQEKKRARRRLVGAVFLSIVAVIVVPKILDSEPRYQTKQIALEIPDPDQPSGVLRINTPPTPPTTPPSPDALSTANTPPAKTTTTDTVNQDGLSAPQGLSTNEEVVPSKIAPIVPPTASPTAPNSANKIEKVEKEIYQEIKLPPNPDKDHKAKVDKDLRDKEQAIRDKEARLKALEKEAKDAKEAKAREDKIREEKDKAKSKDATSKEHLADAKRPEALLNNATNKLDMAATGKYAVQVGAFASEDKVKELQDKIRAAGIKVYSEQISTASGTRTRVRLGPFASREAADKAQSQVKAMGYDGALLNLSQP